jgi:taurine dioxygenase
MDLNRLSERIGASVSDLDLAAPFGEDVKKALREAISLYGLLCFRQGDLAVEDQLRIVSIFAEVSDEKGDGTKHIFVSNVREGAVLGRPDGLLFHSDCVYMAAPLSVLSLYVIEMPRSPSPTVFANNVTVMDDLRLRLAEARGHFVGGPGGYERLREESAPDDARRVEHPVLYADTLAPRPPLLVDELYFDYFIGWDREESDTVRQEIHRHAYAEKNTYVHNWEVGDLIVWDNVALQHRIKPVPEDGPRTLRRVMGLDSSVTEYEHLTGPALVMESVRGR